MVTPTYTGTVLLHKNSFEMEICVTTLIQSAISSGLHFQQSDLSPNSEPSLIRRPAVPKGDRSSKSGMIRARFIEQLHRAQTRDLRSNCARCSILFTSECARETHSFTIRLRTAVRRMWGTASILLRFRARACRSLHGVRSLQGSFRP